MDIKEPRKDVKISMAASRSLDELAAMWKLNRKASCELAIDTMLKQNRGNERAKSEELLQRMLGVIEHW
jgi:hypothetical protein